MVHGLVDPPHLGSSWTRNWTYVSCVGRRILYHWATREGLKFVFVMPKNLLDLAEWNLLWGEDVRQNILQNIHLPSPLIANSFEKHCIGSRDCLSNSSTVQHPPSSRIGHHFLDERWIHWGGLDQRPCYVKLGIFRSFCREMLTSWEPSGEGDHRGRVDSGSLFPIAPRKLLCMWKVWNLLIIWLRLLFWGTSLVVHD